MYELHNNLNTEIFVYENKFVFLNTLACLKTYVLCLQLQCIIGASSPTQLSYMHFNHRTFHEDIRKTRDSESTACSNKSLY